MAQVICVKLNKAEAPSLGFRLQGGKDFGTPLLIQKVNMGSPAERSGLHAGDSVIKINNTDVYNLRHKDAQDVIIRAGPAFEITVQRGGSTWKPSVTPTASIPAPQPSINNVSPVTKTSLAAVPQSSIGAIGTGHNLSAKPFSPQLNGAVNGSSKLVNKQYNSPVGLYSEESIAETLSAQAEVLSTGVLGVNFKKNEKNYDASNSEVFRMVQEADKEPRDQEPEPDTGVVSLPVAVAGLRHVIAPETKATPPTPQLPPGQNICADCERLIVGVFVRIKDKNLHVECFKCSTCGTSLKNVGYYNINNKLYCDVHAKLAARSNPPGPNLIPVTLPPGKPAGTISAALATHPVPTNAPISPSSNTFAQPFQHSEIVPLTEPDGLHQEDDAPKLVKKLTSICDQNNVQNGEKTYTTEKTFTIHNNNEKDILKISGPIPFSQYIAKAGTNFGPNLRPFSSVTAPLSSSLNSYASLPKTPAPASYAPAPSSYAPAPSSFAPAPTSFAPAPVAPLPGRSIQNIVWPPPPDDCDFPTASPLYFPPPSNLKAPSPPARLASPPKIAPPPLPKTEIWRSPTVTTKSERLVEEHSAVKSEIREEVSDYTEAEEIVNYTQNADPKMSFCSAEVTGIIDRRSATQCIETIAETQMLVESVMQHRPKSPPPIDQDLQPKVEVQTEPKDRKSNPSPNEPRIVTRVCVCTNSCCNASEGQLCESCPMKEPAVLKRPGDYHKKKSVVGNAVPRKYESPKITGVSVTINNPGKIKGAIDSFAQIPTKKTTGALGSALSVAPVEPFTPISPNPLEPVPLPQETKPYFPPEHKTVAEPRPPPKEKEPKPDTQFVSALRIAPDRAFTPVDQPAPVKKKKPKEDPLLKDLPKPVQWMSMISALTTAPDRPYSPFVVETSKEITQTEEVRVEEIRQIKETQKEILRRSSQHQSSLPKPFTKPVMHEKFEAVNDDRQTMHVHFPPISDELKSSYDYKADYSQIKSEISSQIVEQAHLEEQTIVTSKQDSRQVEKCEKVCQKTCEAAKTCCKSQTNVIEKQTEETVLKKPLELAGCLHKREYLPQYQMSLNYDETIQLPHHKDIKKLLPSDQNKQQDTRRSAGPKVATQGHQQHAYEPSPQYKQDPPTKKLTTIQPGEVCLNIPQMSFQPVVEDRPPRTSFSPRPGSLTPSMINKPAPTLPYYQANLVAQEYLAPEVNLFDPKSPDVSRSPSPCPDGRRSPSPFCRQPPRPVSPAAGPPPNPLKGAKIPKFTKEDRMREEAKKNITAFIPQYQGKVGSVSMNVDTEQTLQITVPSQQSSSSTQKSQQMTRSIAESCKVQQSQEVSESVQIQRRKVVAEEYEHTQKSKVVEIKTSSSGHQFQKVNNPEVEEHGILGLHVTNPQPINSPFISKDKGQDVSKTSQQPQQSQQSQQPQQPQQPQQSQQPKQSQSIPPQQPNTSFLQSSNAPKQVKPVSAPVSKSAQPTPSTSSNKPNVPLPNSGAGGGKQAGAIGVAPKRGRGVLNVGGLMGTRIATCGHCHGQIRGPFITALGKIWCPDHFICSTQSCRRPLQDLGFVEEQGQLYCEYCFEQYLAPPCSKCSAKVKGDCLKAIGKNFHPECFNCTYCGKLFGNSPFFLEDGAPYCENDWNELFTTKCFACGFPVEAGDRWVEALNNNYHSQCFNCTMCKKNLEGQSFFAKGGRPFCKNHAR